MRTVAQGGSITLRVEFRLATGDLIDPADPHVDILAPDGSTIVNDAQPIKSDVGVYEYTYGVSALADLGTWTAQWFGTYAGVSISASEAFGVVSPAEANTTAQIITRLRRMLGERIPLGKTEADTRFTDAEISDTYYYNGEDINKTMAELWLAKAAYLGDFVDVNESGTTRALSQLGKAAMVQSDRWAARVSAEDTAWAQTYRAMARSFSPYSDGEPLDRVRSGAVVVVVEDPQRLWSGTGI